MTIERPSLQEIEAVLMNASHNNLIGKNDVSAVFFCYDNFTDKINILKSSFPNNSLHTIAVKALPFPKLLSYFKQAGLGAEVASLGELEIALYVGFPAEKIVFDSPAKTKQELYYALNLGCHINADNFDELERIATWVQEENLGKPPKNNIGLRINPQIGKGRISSTAVADEYSKFGIPIKEYADQIINYFKKYDWLDCMHMHIGSQGCEIDMLVEGAKTIDGLIQKIEASGHKKIKKVDIGGGLPASYYFDEKILSFDHYAKEIFHALPHWQAGENAPSIITEFGRHLTTNAAWAMSNVEYVKPSKDIYTAIGHLGADMFLRKCYRSSDWHHEISIFSKKDQSFIPSGDETVAIGGPLCFAGDIIGKIQLAYPPQEDDKIIIHDVGAYTLSMWSRYNSRFMPAIFSYERSSCETKLIKAKETASDILSFWQ